MGHVLISGSLGPAPEQVQLSPLTSLSLSPELSPSWVPNCSHQKRGHPYPQPSLSCPFQGATHWPLLVYNPSPGVHGQSSGGPAGPASVRAPGAAGNPEPAGWQSSRTASLDFAQGSAQSRRGGGVGPLLAGALQPDRSICCPEEAQERPGSGLVITATVGAMGSPALAGET